MLRIIYNDKVGMTVPDGLVLDTVQDLLKQYQEGKTSAIAIGSTVLLDAFRLAISKEQIGVDEIEFQIDGAIVGHNKYGKIDTYPKCDVHIDIVSDLLWTAGRNWGKPVPG